MIPTMLLAGTGFGLLAVGRMRTRSIALAVLVASLAWGAGVGVNASSVSVGVGGTALAAINVAVAIGVVWAIAWPIRRNKDRPRQPSWPRRRRHSDHNTTPS